MEWRDVLVNVLVDRVDDDAERVDGEGLLAKPRRGREIKLSSVGEAVLARSVTLPYIASERDKAVADGAEAIAEATGKTGEFLVEVES